MLIRILIEWYYAPKGAEITSKKVLTAGVAGFILVAPTHMLHPAQTAQALFFALSIFQWAECRVSRKAPDVHMT